MEKKKDLFELPVRKGILTLAIPMMLSGFLQNAFSLVDMFFVGKLGTSSLAALSISGFILGILIIGISGITAGTVTLIAHFKGKREDENANMVIWQTIFLSLILWIFSIIIGVFFTEKLLLLFGAKGDVVKKGNDYLRVSFLLSGVIFIFISLNQALRGAGDAKTPLKILLISNLLNVALDPFFIFGISFFPELGVTGSAIATVISRFVGLVLTISILSKKSYYLKLSFHYFKVLPKFINRILKIGFFTSFQFFLRNLSLLFLTKIVSVFGAKGIASYGVGSRLRMVLMIIIFGFSNAAGVLVGQNMGAKNEEKAKMTLFESLKICQLIILPFELSLLLFAPFITGIFTKDAEIIRITSNFLRFQAVSFPFLATSILTNRSLTGAGDTAFPTTFVGLYTFFLRIILSYFLAIKTPYGINGVWLSIAITDVLMAISIILYFKTERWKNIYYNHRQYLEN